LAEFFVNRPRIVVIGSVEGWKRWRWRSIFSIARNLINRRGAIRS
jgi:hypothetical protein